MSARLMLLSSSLVLAALHGLCGSSRAEAVRPPSEAAEHAMTARKPQVDESALRYYASVKQTDRVEAETRRLQRLNPDWQPPSDLWTLKPGNSDDGPLWELFAADKLDELRAAIRVRQTLDRNWTPSTDLEQKLRRKEIRASIVASTRSRRWADVATSGNKWRSEIDAGDVELLWQIAEGYARTRRAADAGQILEAILKSSSDSKERVATIHKAIALLPMIDTERLIAMGQADASGKSEFDVIAIDITRARISAWLHDAPGNDISAPEFAVFQDYALAAPDPNQVALLAWYALKRADLREALQHFKSAIEKGGDATVAHGLAHTLKRLGQLRDAEEVAYAWREPSPANAILFIDILAEQLTQGVSSFDPKRLARYADVILQTASGEGAQALAWYAYNSCQLDAAAEWFRRAIAWFPKETTTMGYALTLRRLKRSQEFLEIVNRYDGLFPLVVALVFPDGSSQSADPCHRISVKPANSRFDTIVRPASGQSSWSRVPMPAKIGAANTLEHSGPKQTEFPIAVVPENPYRSQSTDSSTTIKSPIDMWRPSGAVAAVIAARRVPGVRPMPYERYGRTLLPGWNGAMQASLSMDLMLRSPRGTQWASDQAASEASPPVGGTPANSAILPQASAATRFHP